MTNQELNDLLASFEESSLSKLKLSTQEFTIEMERAVSAPAAPVIPAAAAAPAVPAAAEPEGDAITAPMVGTFYAASAPEQPPFVKVGDRVRKGQPVCLLEAMKMMSEIPAPCDCEITAVLKENGALSSAKPLYSMSDCVPSSIRSIRKITLSASLELAISWADLKLVIVLPDPVVCHT